MGSGRFRYFSVAFLVLAAFAAAYYFSTEEPTPTGTGAVSWRSFDDGMALAKQSNKKLLVDVYTTWCSWCKKMDSEVYTDPRVAKMINDHFVAVKLNAESNKSLSYNGKNLDEAGLARELGVTGYPTTVFFDQQSVPITSVPGFSPADNFANLLGFIGQDYYKSISFQEYISRESSHR